MARPEARQGAEEVRTAVPGGVVNVDQAADWDGAEGDQWLAQEERYDAFFGRQSRRLLDAAHIRADDRVLDIGCGCGQSTRGAARRAVSGTVLGVDLSARMLDRARTRSRAAGLTNVQFEQGDAQVFPFEPWSRDLAISQFGAMFFADPVAAFRNIGRAMRPGGRVAILAWQQPGKNEWLSALRDALAVGRTLPPPPVGIPGPFGLADPDAVRGLLIGAGFVDICFDAVNEPVYLGPDAGAALGFACALPVTQRLLAGLSSADHARALDRLRATLASHATGDGILLGSSAWLITAHRPHRPGARTGNGLAVQSACGVPGA
jgi:SAM-dependent methyltransferase